MWVRLAICPIPAIYFRQAALLEFDMQNQASSPVMEAQIQRNRFTTNELLGVATANAGLIAGVVGATGPGKRRQGRTAADLWPPACR